MFEKLAEDIYWATMYKIASFDKTGARWKFNPSYAMLSRQANIAGQNNKLLVRRNIASGVRNNAIDPLKAVPAGKIYPRVAFNNRVRKQVKTFKPYLSDTYEYNVNGAKNTFVSPAEGGMQFEGEAKTFSPIEQVPELMEKSRRNVQPYELAAKKYDYNYNNNQHLQRANQDMYLAAVNDETENKIRGLIRKVKTKGQLTQEESDYIRGLYDGRKTESFSNPAMNVRGKKTTLMSNLFPRFSKVDDTQYSLKEIRDKLSPRGQGDVYFRVSDGTEGMKNVSNAIDPGYTFMSPPAKMDEAIMKGKNVPATHYSDGNTPFVLGAISREGSKPYANAKEYYEQFVSTPHIMSVNPEYRVRYQYPRHIPDMESTGAHEIVMNNDFLQKGLSNGNAGFFGYIPKNDRYVQLKPDFSNRQLAGAPIKELGYTPNVVVYEKPQPMLSNDEALNLLHAVFNENTLANGGNSRLINNSRLLSSPNKYTTISDRLHTPWDRIVSA